MKLPTGRRLCPAAVTRLRRPISLAVSLLALAVLGGYLARVAAGQPAPVSPATRVPESSLGERIARDRFSGARAASTPAAELPWGALLSEELDREVYDLTVELDRYLASSAWNDAARHIHRGMEHPAHGLAPAPEDPVVLRTWPLTVHAALRRHPELVAALEREHGELLLLRVERAIQNRRIHDVEQLARVYPGLLAAQRGLAWQADQLLARGAAAEALQCYLQTAELLRQDMPLRARAHIAAALAGETFAEPVTTTVQLGDTLLSPPQLTELTKELRQRHQPATDGHAETPFWADHATIHTTLREPLEMVVGNDPQVEVLTGMDATGVDWPGRQLSAARAEDLLLVHNRFELVALDWRTGQLRWTSHPLGEHTLRSRDWPLIHMRCEVHEDQVYVRHLHDQTPQVACWQLHSGQLIWSRGWDKQVPVSDPFFLDGELAVLLLDPPESVQGTLMLQYLTRGAGGELRSHPLLRLRNHWWRRACCQVTVQGNRFFAILGGVCFAATSNGVVEWIRSTPTASPEADSSWMWQVHQPPLACNGVLVLHQPGMAAIESVDAISGSRLWQTSIPGVQQVLGIVDGQVIVKTGEGIAAIRLLDGGTSWRHSASSLLMASACTPHAAMYTRVAAARDSEGRATVELVLLALRDGTVEATVSFPELSGSQPGIGPLIVGGDRAWTFFSPTTRGGQRDLVQWQSRTRQDDAAISQQQP